MEDAQTKQVKKIKYLGSVITEKGKCDTLIRRSIGIEKRSFLKAKQSAKKEKIQLQAKSVLNGYVLSVLLAEEMRFYRRIQKILWMEKVSKMKV